MLQTILPWSTGSNDHTTSVAWGDVNGDGLLDLAVGNDGQSSKVYLNKDQDGAAQVLCLDARTGQTVWQAARKAFRACYSTPFVLQRAGEEAELIVASTAGISGYHPNTGAEIWKYTWTFARNPLRTVASPVAGSRTIVPFGGSGVSRVIPAIASAFELTQ